MNVLDSIKNTANGLATLKDWLGEGLTHVPQEQADRRAMACHAGNEGKECPHHIAPRWWEYAKGEIADAMREQMRVKNYMNLATPLEDSLKVCSLCGCSMPLKVWTPIEHIKAHTSAKLALSYPDFCWQRKELKAS